MKKYILVIFIGGMLISATAKAGSVLELLTSEFTMDPPVLGTVEIITEDNSTRLEITSVSSNESGGLIYHGGRKEIIVIEHDRQEYYVISREQIERMAVQVEEAMKQMEEALAVHLL